MSGHSCQEIPPSPGARAIQKLLPALLSLMIVVTSTGPAGAAALILPEALEMEVDEYVADVAAQLRPRAAASLCAAGKLRTAGIATDKKLECHAKAARRGTGVEQVCLDGQTDKLADDFADAELGTDCLTANDAPEVNALTDGFVGAIADDVRPSPAADLAAAAILRCVGRKAADKVSCHARGTENGSSADEACHTRAEEKFVDCFVRAKPPARGPVKLEVIVIEPFGKGSVEGVVSCKAGNTCSKSFAPGTLVHLFPIARGGAAFDRWSPDNLCLIPGASGCSFIIQDDVAITAIFGAGVRLNVRTGDNGGGRVISEPPLIIDTASVQSKTVLSGSDVVILAQPSDGQEFDGWRGEPPGAEPCVPPDDPRCALRLDGPTQVVAEFSPAAEAFEGPLHATGTQSRDFGPPIGLCTWTTTIEGTVALTIESSDAGTLSLDATQTNISDQPPTQCLDSTNEFDVEFPVELSPAGAFFTSITGETILGDFDIDFEGSRFLGEDEVEGTLTFALIAPFTGSMVDDVVLDRLP